MTFLFLAISTLTLNLASNIAWSAEPEKNCSTLVASGNAEYPPYLWRDPKNPKRLIGANADYLNLLAKEINVKIKSDYSGPWARVQEEMKYGRIDLIAGAFYTVPRLEYMDYFFPAFKETRTVIWVREDSKLNYKHWSDLVGHAGVTVINNSFGEEFDNYAKKALSISHVASLEQALAMLQNSRVDYLIYEEAPGYAYIAKKNLTGLKTLSPSISNESLHLTLSHKSKCNTPELRGKIAKAVYSLEKQGVMDSLIEKNIQLWKKQESEAKAIAPIEKKDP